MPISEANAAKIRNLTTGTLKPSPLPPVPKLTLSDGDRARMPSLAEAVDAYNADMEKFFKEQKIGG